MLALNNYNECLSQGKEKLEVAQSLRAKYPASGLYPENSPIAQWTVDWYSYEVFISANGEYLVRTGPWATDGSSEALSFFNKGKLLKSYKVDDLVRYVSALPHSVSHFQWEQSLKVDNDKNTLEAITLENGQFMFDLKTGEVLSQHLPIIPSSEGLTQPSFLFRAIGALLVIFLCLAILIILRKVLYRNQKP